MKIHEPAKTKEQNAYLREGNLHLVTGIKG